MLAIMEYIRSCLVNWDRACVAGNVCAFLSYVEC